MRSFFDWWFSQLAAMIPVGLLKLAASTADAVILEFDRHSVRLVLRKAGERTRLSESSANVPGIQDLVARLSAETELPHSVLLRPQPDLVLHKRLSLPFAARRDLDNALRFEIDRETPFAHDDVYWTYRVMERDKKRGRLDVELALVPRSIVDPLLTSAKSAHLRPTGIEVDIGGMTMLVGLGHNAPARWLRVERPLMPLAATAAGLAALAIFMPFIVQQVALASAEATIASLAEPAREAATLRQSAGQFAAAADFFAARNQGGAALSVLAAATRALPDESHLTALSIRDGRVTMTGLSPSAAELIGLLAKNMEFHEPAFAAPVVHSEDSDLESFTIAAALGTKGAP